MSKGFIINGGGGSDGLEKFLNALTNGGLTLDAEDDSEDPKNINKRLPITEVQVAEINEFAERYAAPNPYAVGDWVTPRKNSLIRGHGRPHKVVEVLPAGEEHRVWHGNPSGGEYGARQDIRVATYTDQAPKGQNVVVTYWGEHHNYEIWDPEKDYTK